MKETDKKDLSSFIENTVKSYEDYPEDSTEAYILQWYLHVCIEKTLNYQRNNCETHKNYRSAIS